MDTSRRDDIYYLYQMMGLSIFWNRFFGFVVLDLPEKHSDLLPYIHLYILKIFGYKLKISQVLLIT